MANISGAIINKLYEMFPSFKNDLYLSGSYDGKVGSLEVEFKGVTATADFTFDSNESTDVILFIRLLANIVSNNIINSTQLDRTEFIATVTQ